MARRGSRIPDSGGPELSDFTSWKNISRAFTGARDSFKRLNEQAANTRKIYEDNRAETQAKNYARFTSGFEQIRGRVGGPQGKAVDSSIANFFKKLEAGGGSKIGNADLSKAIAEFQKDLGRIASTTTGIQGDLLRDLVHDLKDAKRNAKDGGLGALGGNSKDFIKTAFGFKADNTIDEAKNDFAKEIKNVASGIADPALKQALNDVRAELHKTANSAKNAAEKQQAVADAAAKLQGLGAGATGADKTAMDGLAKNAAKNTDELKKALAVQEKSRRWQGLNNGIANLNHAIGSSLKYLQPLKRTFDVGNAIFQQVNSKFNQFARMQMKISSERGAYGRVMRGAGMDFSSMMSAIGTGRRAGMDDREVVDKMATMQEQLARARWGEGPIIENLGKWGLTPFDENGNMKDFKRVMIDISNKFNTLGSDMERLQFLSMQGFKPEQMEFVKNYARDAKRWEEIKKNPHLQGVLESARILDESGLSAKTDAATKIELKRRQILNQNAIDDGLWEGFKRSIHPENWFFNDWTARQKGLAQAKAEQANEKLTRAILELTSQMKKGGNGGEGFSVGKGLTIQDLAALGLSGGLAKQDLENKGAKSRYHILRQVYADSTGFNNMDEVEEKNKTATGWERAIEFGSAALPILLMIASKGKIKPAGASKMSKAATLAKHAVKWGAVAAGTGSAMYAGYQAGRENPTSYFSDASDEFIDKVREAVKQNKPMSEVQELLKQKGWQGMTLAQLMSKDFMTNYEAAREAGQAQYQINLGLKAQRKVGSKGVVNPFEDWHDKYTIAAQQQNMRLTDEDIVEAMVRKTTGKGLPTGKVLQNYIENGWKLDETRLAQIQGDIEAANPNWAPAKIEAEAEKKAKSEFYDSLESGTISNYITSKTTDEEKARKNNIANLKEQYKDLLAEAKNIGVEEYKEDERGGGAGGLRMKDGEYTRQMDLGFREMGIGVGTPLGAMEAMSNNAEIKKQQDEVIKALRELKSAIEKETKAQENTEQDKEKQMVAERDKLFAKGGLFEGKKLKFGDLFDFEQREALNAELSANITPRGETDTIIDKTLARGLSYNMIQKAWDRAKEDVAGNSEYGGLSDEEKASKMREIAEKYVEEYREEAAKAIDIDNSERGMKSRMSLGGRLSRFARQKNVSLDSVRNLLFKADEVDEIEDKLEKGKEFDAATKDRFEEYKKGSDYKTRQKKKEAEKKKQEDEKSRRSEELEGFRAMEQAGIELTAAEGERKQRLEQEFGAEEGAAIKMAEARGGVLSPEIASGVVEAEKAKKVELTEEDQKQLNVYHQYHSAEAGMDTKEKRAEKWKAQGETDEDIQWREKAIEDNEHWMRGFQNRVGNFTAKQVYDAETGKTSFEVMASEAAKNASSSPEAVQYAIKMAEARGGIDIDKKFAKADVEKYRAEEAKRKEAFIQRGLGSEEQYEDYKSVEGAILRGEEISDDDRKFYTETKQKLDKATERLKQTEYKPLNEEYVPEVEAAAEEDTLRNARVAVEEGAAMKKRGDLNKLSDMRRIDDFKKKGWSDKKIQQNFGKDRKDEYKAAVAAGEYEDHDKVRKDNARVAFEKKNRAGLEATGLAKEKVDEIMKERMASYDAGVAKKEQTKAEREAAQETAVTKMGMVKPGFPTDEGEDVTAVMNEKSEGVAQASERMAQAGESAETAAASAKKAEGGTVNADNSVTINMGGQQITQNIQGTYPMDQGGMRNGTLEGAEEICEMAVQRVTDAVNSVTKSKGSY